ncbi:MAG: Unknown protein [uncultured Sulfurovum sp.]|uniref:Uncharacterized protein n=1 Tax=uncultured Sulfurovum sp. TaxID=269237 RepID=A0A6S6SRD8_9BACT|nr:MAG: Unknown protein [uncultured Sulfurovum sp.]
MKKLTLLLTPFIFILGLNAQEINQGSTFHQYSKPGAPIDMRYTTQKVDLNETSDVNISLSTTVTKGSVSVLITLDENLKSLKSFDNNLSFEIKPGVQDFLIDLQVKSEKQGLYYIRLLTKVHKEYGSKLRSFAVPVYIGQESAIKSKSISSSMKALGSGENISVSKAIETIQILKEK